MTDVGEADRLWLRASELRLVADYLEDQARQVRGGRQPLDHHRYFKLLEERDGPYCTYCRRRVHPFDQSHEPVDVWACAGSGGGEYEPIFVCRDDDPLIPWQRCAHIDHRTPVSEGGSNELENLVLSCVQCNLRKGASPEAAFRRRLLLERSDERQINPDDLDPAFLLASPSLFLLWLVEGLLAEAERPRWLRLLSERSWSEYRADLARWSVDDSEPF